ncbi:MAG: hypothetical protein RI894_2269 [Bacteroidota bacterium]|jgi:uncharacterized membrane protein
MYPIFLTIHIVAGVLSLLSAPVALIAQKGGQVHRTAGLVFYYSMLVVSIAAMLVSVVHFNDVSIFLRGIAIFSFYLVAAGKRILQRKDIMNGQKGEPIDYILTAMIASFVIFCFYYGYTFHSVVLYVFGALATRFVYEDIVLLRNQPTFKLYWLTAHISRMCGGAIASFTAFLVVNSKHILGDANSVFAWLLPTAIGVPIIFYYARQTKNKAAK